MLIDESDHFRRFGSSSDAKKLRRPSTTHWCPATLDSRAATVRFLQQGPRALIPQHVLRDERPASIASPCAMTHPALVPRSCRLPAWKCSPPGCGLPRGGPHGPSHPDQIFSACSKFSHLLKRNKTWGTSGDRVNEDGASRLSEVRVGFDLSFPDTPEGNQARRMVDNLIRISHEKDCTVSRTVENPTRVTFANDSK